MAAPIRIARTLHYSLRGCLAAIVHSGVRYELTRTSVNSYVASKRYWQSTRYLVR